MSATQRDHATSMMHGSPTPMGASAARTLLVRLLFWGKNLKNTAGSPIKGEREKMTETASNELRAAKEASGKSYRQIAQEIGIPKSSALIHKIVEKDEYASLETLYKICRTIGIEDKAYKVYQEREETKNIENLKTFLDHYEGERRKAILEDIRDSHKRTIDQLESGL